MVVPACVLSHITAASVSCQTSSEHVEMPCGVALALLALSTVCCFHEAAAGAFPRASEAEEAVLTFEGLQTVRTAPYAPLPGSGTLSCTAAVAARERTAVRAANSLAVKTML